MHRGLVAVTFLFSAATASAASSESAGAGAIDGLFGAIVVALLVLLLICPNTMECQEDETIKRDTRPATPPSRGRKQAEG